MIPHVQQVDGRDHCGECWYDSDPLVLQCMVRVGNSLVKVASHNLNTH